MSHLQFFLSSSSSCVCTDERCEEVLEIVGHDEVKEYARELWAANPGITGKQKWELLSEAINKFSGFSISEGRKEGSRKKEIKKEK